MSILVVFVLGLVALLLMVALIARFALVAHSSRLSAGWLAELFAHLSPPLASLAKQCQTCCLTLVRWPVKRPADHESYNSAVALLFRLLCLPLSLAILLADFSLTQLRSDALYHLTPTLLHLPLDILLGVIWVLVPIAWALLLAEALGRLPVELWLFPPLQSGRWLRLVIGLFALVGFLSALVLNFGFQIYGQCVLIRGCQTDSGLEILVAGGFQTLLVATALPAFLGLVLGLGGAVSLLLLLLWCVCSLLAKLCWLCARSLQGLGTIAQDLHESAHTPAYQRGKIDFSDKPIFTPSPGHSRIDYSFQEEYELGGKEGELHTW